MTPEGDFQRAVYRAEQLDGHEIDWPSYLRKRENEELAKRIEKFWTERGFPKVRAWVESEGKGNDGFIYGVRSNLVNGEPPR